MLFRVRNTSYPVMSLLAMQKKRQEKQTNKIRRKRWQLSHLLSKCLNLCLFIWVIPVKVQTNFPNGNNCRVFCQFPDFCSTFFTPFFCSKMWVDSNRSIEHTWMCFGLQYSWLAHTQSITCKDHLLNSHSLCLLNYISNISCKPVKIIQEHDDTSMKTVKRDPWASFPLHKGMQQDADLSMVISTSIEEQSWGAGKCYEACHLYIRADVMNKMRVSFHKTCQHQQCHFTRLKTLLRWILPSVMSHIVLGWQINTVNQLLMVPM